MINIIYQRYKILAWLLVLFAMSAQAGYVSTGLLKSKHGYVMARVPVLDQNGKMVLVEYDKNGKEIAPLALSMPTDQVAVISAAEYQMQQVQLQQYMAEHRNDLGRDAILMTRSTFDATQFMAVDNKTEILKPTLSPDIKSVLVRGQANRLLVESRQLVLLAFTVDLAQAITLSPNTSTLVIDKQGHVLAQFAGVVAPRSGFIEDGTGKVLDDGQLSQNISGQKKPMGPMSGAQVFTMEPFTGQGATDSKGYYAFNYRIMPCPIGGFTFTTTVWLKLNYQAFTPRGSSILPYYMRMPGSDYCFATLFSVPTNVVDASIEPTVMQILSNLSEVNPQSNFYVDVMFLSGQVSLANPDGSAIKIGESTEYSVNTPSSIPVTDVKSDFDGDNRQDRVVLGNIEPLSGADGVERQHFVAQLVEGATAKYQGIYFSSRTNQQGEPDLIRLADTKKNQSSNGLLTSISKSDLQATDILIFRESTGELILARKGVKEQELGDTGLTGQGKFYYRLMLRGPADLNWNIGGGGDRQGTWQQWASSYGMAEPYQKKNANHLKSGETIKIVAINRASGYMASQLVTLRDLSQNSSLTVPDMVLMPPNLKIWAERAYTVDDGVTAGQSRSYLVGQEGMSLTSDDTINVFTEWLDRDGKPLPAGLGDVAGKELGLTGRLAKVVAANQLQADGEGQVASFAIQPGRHTQVLKVKDNLPTREHYYVHVSGTAQNYGPSFDAGAWQGVLKGRPAHLTPFLTPQYDDEQTWLEYSQYHQLKAQQLESPVSKPKASYRWLYRPEYQFSRYQLTIQNMTAEVTEDGTGNTEDILHINNRPLTELDTLLQLFYQLYMPTSPLLDPLDGPRELVFALGDAEVQASITDNGVIRFEKTTLDTLRALQPDDYLALRLYSNQDAGNVLWEWAFAGPSGLRVSYALPEPLTLLSEDTTALGSGIPGDAHAFRTLGGIRMKLEYAVQPGEQLLSWAWDLPSVAAPPDVAGAVTSLPGCYPDFFIADANLKPFASKPCTQQAGADQNTDENAITLYWQPDWDNSNIQTSLQIKYRTVDGNVEDKKIPVLFARRELKAQANDPMKGSDVAMLEQMLWQLGISPQYGFPGMSGSRIDKIRNASLKRSKDIYSVGWDSNFTLRSRDSNKQIIPENVIAKQHASIELMIRRFKGRSVIDDYSLGAVDDRIAGKNENGNLDMVSLRHLGYVFADYLIAVHAFPHRSFGKAEIENNWWDDFVDALDGHLLFSGSSSSIDIPGTYTQDIHEKAMQAVGLDGSEYTRIQLAKSWVSQELDHKFWGDSPEIAFRITEGSGEERGSFGFSQIQFPMSPYGQATCAKVANINLYHPKNNLLSMVAYAASSGRNCGNSFYLAYISKKYDVDFVNAAADPHDHNSDATLVGYGVRESNGDIKYIKTGDAAREPDDYDRLNRSLSGYNGSTTNLYRCSLPDMIAGIQKGNTLCSRPSSGNDNVKNYSMKILHDGAGEKLKLPYRVYVWKSGAICFAYGEHEWISSGVTWDRYKNDVINGQRPSVVCP